MYRSRVSLGSLAATTAMICVLSLSPPAVSSEGGFFNLPLAQAQCSFTAETHVPMADGAEDQIGRNRPGNRVVSRIGGVNRVTGTHMVPLGPRALFGTNQHPPFFTAEHPFLTPGGWRALDRAATWQETPGLEVAALTAGDALITAAAVSGETAGAPALTPAVSFRELALRRLTRAEGDPADNVYNLIFDGDHSYVANNFMAHDKGGEGGQGNGQSNGKAAGGLDVAADMIVASDTTTVDPATTGNEAVSPTTTAEDTDAERTGVASGEFSGSAAPAGPDLSATEEKDVISSGWK
jgi:hypothetical protein